MTSSLALYLQASLVLLVAYGGAAWRVYRRRDLLDVVGLSSAIAGSLFGIPAFDLISHPNLRRYADERSQLSEILLMTLSAVVALLVVAWVVDRRTHSDEPRPSRGVEAVRSRQTVLCLLGVALLSAVAMQIGADGILGRASNPLAQRSTDSYPAWYFFAQGGLTFAQLAWWIAIASERRLRSWPVVVAGIIAVALSLSQGRLMVVNLVIPVVLLVHYHRRRLTPRVAAVLLVATLVYFLAWDAYREARRGPEGGGVRVALSPTGVWRGVTDNLDYGDSFLLLIGKDPSLRWGKTFLAPATKPVPRSVWAGKPYGGNSELTEIIFPGLLATGFSRAASAEIEGYLNFGVIGPALLLGLVGGLGAGSTNWRTRRRNDPMATLWYAIGFVGLLSFVRADAQIATTYVAYYAIPLGVIRLVRLRQEAGKTADVAPTAARVTASPELAADQASATGTGTGT